MWKSHGLAKFFDKAPKIRRHVRFILFYFVLFYFISLLICFLPYFSSKTDKECFISALFFKQDKQRKLFFFLLNFFQQDKQENSPHNLTRQNESVKRTPTNSLREVKTPKSMVSLFASPNLLPTIFLAFSWICHMVTSLFDLFMKTLISQCFRKCDKFTSLCGAIRDVNEICKPKSRTKVREKRQHFAEHVAGDFRITTPFTIRHQL